MTKNYSARWYIFCRAKIYILLLLCILSMHLSVYAQKADTTSMDYYMTMSLEELMNIKVSVATKVEQNIDDAPGNIIVITRKQITDMNARTLKDVLNVFVPGMDALPASMKYGDRVETVYSRGINSDFSQQILYLYNGKNKFNETTFGQPLGFIEFTLEGIEKIEISTSPVPLQGGSAVTIINLVTRDQSMDGTEVFLNTGFKDGLLNKKATVVYGKKIDDWHIGGSLQFYADKGVERSSLSGTGPGGSTIPDPKYMRDGTKAAYNFTLNVQSPDKKVEFGTWYKSANQDAYLSGILPWTSGYTQNYIGKQLQTYLTWKASKHLDITAGYMWHYLAYPGFPFYNTQTNFDTYLEANYTHQLGKHKEHALLVGGKIEREGQIGNTSYFWDNRINDFRDTTAYPLAPNQSRNVTSLYADDNWTLSSRFSILAGLRLDHYHNFAHTKISVLNPRIGVSYKFTDRLTLKGLFATAHRPPTLYELTGQTLLPLYGNPNLKTEHINNFEMNMIYKTSNVKVKISAFNQIYKDQIIYLPIDKNLSDRDTTQASNAGNTNVWGADLSINYYLDKDSYIFFNAAKLKTKTAEGTSVHFLPSLYINGGVNFKMKAVDVNLTSYFRGKRPMPASYVINTREASGTIFTSNLSVSYNLNSAIRFYTLIQNLFDRHDTFPLSIDGYYIPMRGRILNIGVTAKI
ncbi:TonB-dependent receptor plug domain-containing protein [Ohtaekwangia koreensis]|uniref:Outer membrane receptor for ferrienterochelin and colicins n=1 Tax=Ohtaekwangia koreensis TaxID=688867 RepID=A0A1T5KLC8_9BACT|nr:TonB-dependent receptor [Ohtaekwangia koreensis]SKC64564.1 Outer membrane receptor for ferrienterochelin and colicins [Ohtaekwangia koreensis]